MYPVEVIIISPWLTPMIYSLISGRIKSTCPFKYMQTYVIFKCFNISDVSGWLYKRIPSSLHTPWPSLAERAGPSCPSRRILPLGQLPPPECLDIDPSTRKRSPCIAQPGRGTRSTNNMTTIVSERERERARQPASQPDSQPASQPASHPAIQPANQPASQPACQRASLPASQRASEPASQRASLPASQRAS